MKVKPDIIKVARYYRPRDYFDSVISNRGITVLFTVNYATKKFDALWSVCNGDNFCKATGVDFAKKCKIPLINQPFNGNVDLFKNLDDCLIALLSLDDSNGSTADTLGLSKKEQHTLLQLYAELHYEDDILCGFGFAPENY